MFTGISALAAALAIPDDGEVISMDISDESLNSCGRKILESSGVMHKIRLEFRPAVESLGKE